MDANHLAMLARVRVLALRAMLAARPSPAPPAARPSPQPARYPGGLPWPPNAFTDAERLRFDGILDRLPSAGMVTMPAQGGVHRRAGGLRDGPDWK